MANTERPFRETETPAVSIWQEKELARQRQTEDILAEAELAGKLCSFLRIAEVLDQEDESAGSYRKVLLASESTSACPPPEENQRLGRALANLEETPDFDLLNEHSAQCSACTKEIVEELFHKNGSRVSVGSVSPKSSLFIP